MNTLELEQKQSAGASLLELHMAADPRAVPEARSRAMQICADVGISTDECFDLDVALGEALANAVMHGAPRREQCRQGPAPIALSLWRYDHSLIIQVCDKGPGFDPPEPPYLMPEPEAGTTHGRGLPLMETLTDAMLACRTDSVTSGVCVYLIKHLPRE